MKKIKQPTQPEEYWLIKPSDLERFASKIELPNSQSCWTWKGCRDQDGYGLFHIQTHRNQQTMLRAHRITYSLYKGMVNTGLVVRHSCDNPPCVNPKHLLLGTHADNMLDKVLRGRAPKGDSHSRSIITEQETEEIKQLISQGVFQRIIAAQYGVSRSLICEIKRGKVRR
jgi:hypothetical protein